MSCFLEVYTKDIVLTILPTLSKHSPSFNLHSHGEQHLPWHVVTLIQENWLEGFSLIRRCARIWLLFLSLLIFVRILFEGNVYFFEKPADINYD